MLTTTDNPFNPFEDFAQWYLFDVEKGYNTCEKLARLVKKDETMSEFQELEAVVDGINFLMKLNPFNNYKVLIEEEDEHKVPSFFGTANE